nr:DNA internalization-related competence protein ComEC/Rec2 [Bacilli bacterium]
MKRIKNLLESKYFLLIVIILTIILCLIPNKKLPIVDNIYQIKHIKVNKNKFTITSDKVLINYYADNVEELNNLTYTYKIGDIIKVDGELSIPNDNTNFNLFNYRLYLKSKKIYYLLKADNISKVSHSNNIIYKIKNKIINKIDKYDRKEYLYTFILGDSNYIDNDIKDSMQSNGISHLFSVSGMHVSLLSLIILSVLNRIRKSNINNIIVIIFLLFYTFLTNYTPSIMRSTLMFILLYLNKIFKLNIKTIYLLIYLFCSFLIYNPYLIYNVGFLFSFSITFFLILFGNNRYKNYFVKLLYTSIVAFIASIPILINNFNSINLLSPIFNLLFVPLVSLIIFPLCLITFVIPIVSPLLNIFLDILEYLTIICDKLSINIILSSVSIFVIIFYYLIITFVLYKLSKKKYKCLILIFIVILIHSNMINLNNEVHFLNVGQGDSILLRLKNKNILIDTGGIIKYGELWKQSDYNITNDVIIPYLKSFGIKKLDYIIISHGDTDHAGEAINLVNNFKVEKVIFNCGEYNDLEKEIINTLNKKKIKYYSCISKLDDLYFLNTKEYDNENDNSNVIYTELNGYKFMFMGDASSTTEKEILHKYNLSDIDILKVGHHGSKTSSSKEFIDKINPNYSVISVGKNNRYGHPNKEVLNNLKDSKIYRTDEDGSIMFKIKDNKLKIETCSP